MDGKKWDNVKPHFAIVSPGNAPKGLDTCDWPAWMKKEDGGVAFIKMPPLHPDLLRTTRWSERLEKQDKDGDRWKAVRA